MLEEYSLEPHHLKLLARAAEAWDRGERAREAIAEHGLTYEDRFVPLGRGQKLLWSGIPEKGSLVLSAS